MFFSVSQADWPDLTVNWNILVHSLTTKFLGILVDNKLNFAPHIRDVCTKVSRGFGVCKNYTLMMLFAVMGKLFFTLIYPFWTYGIEIWGHSSVIQLNRLGSKLNKSVTIIVKKPTRRENHIKLNTKPLRNVCKFFTLIRVFKNYRLKHMLALLQTLWHARGKAQLQYKIQ